MNKNISPVNWYVGSYLLRHIEIESPNNDDPEARFLAWENTVLVKAENKYEAYEKIEEIGKEHDYPYKGGKEAVDVRFEFLGVTSVLAIYEEIEDGAEIMWAKYTRKLKNLRNYVITKEESME